MTKKTIKINEAQLRNMIADAIENMPLNSNTVLNESFISDIFKKIFSKEVVKEPQLKNFYTQIYSAYIEATNSGNWNELRSLPDILNIVRQPLRQEFAAIIEKLISAYEAQNNIINPTPTANQGIHITESQLRNMIAESINKALMERKD